MSLQTQVITSLNLAVLLQLAGLVIAVARDTYIGREHRNLLLSVTILLLSLILQNHLDNALSLRSDLPAMLRKIIIIYGYCARPALLALFIRIVNGDRRPWLIVIANGLINLTALFADIVFTIENGHFVRGPMGYTCHVAGFLLVIWLTVASVQKYRSERKRDAFPLAVALLLIAATVVDTLFVEDDVISFLAVSAVSGSVFYYIWLHRHLVREHEQALLAEQRGRILMAQIQPHFIFNSLTAIRAVYRTDEEKGERAITEFADYLRHNMDALAREETIPFEKELEHVRRYLSLQQLRFGDKLRVSYELGATDLSIPTLTLQPLVENAVTYGVRQSATGQGTVTIRSRELTDRWEIEVTDDGPGFVPENELHDGEKSHIGLQNVRDRLQLVCGGSLVLRSAPGQGTTATIVLPKTEVKPV